LSGTNLAAIMAEERRIMNTWAPHYDAAAFTNGYVYRLERAQFTAWVARTVRQAGHEPHTLSVLDAGCGTGDVIERLFRLGFMNLTGLDLAEGMLREARQREVVGARWVEASIEDPPFSRDTFDVILACFTLHHLFDPQAFFRLVDLTLRPGGWFFILELDLAPQTWRRSFPWKYKRVAGNLVRAAFARKNRRPLAPQPTVPRIYNPAHRVRGFEEIMRAIERPERYDIRQESRGVLLPALTSVLVEESSFDRTLARWVGAVDHWLAPRVGGVFQWVAGRRRS